MLSLILIHLVYIYNKSYITFISIILMLRFFKYLYHSYQPITTNSPDLLLHISGMLPVVPEVTLIVPGFPLMTLCGILKTKI